jgi:hypothetical protein
MLGLGKWIGCSSKFMEKKNLNVDGTNWSLLGTPLDSAKSVHAVTGIFALWELYFLA